MLNSLNVIKNKTFLLFFTSDIISGFGVGMTTIGANWFMLMKTGSTASVGQLLAVNVLMGFFASLFSGALVDRIPRRSLIFMTHLARALAMGIVMMAMLSENLNIVALYLFAAVNGIGWTLYMAASRSFLQEIMDKESYVAGNSLLEISLQVGMFVAAAAAGFLYQSYSFEMILAVALVMYLISAILIIGVKHNSVVCSTEKGSYLETLHGGVSYLIKHKSIFVLGLVAICPLVVTMMFNVVLPDHVRNTLMGDSVTFGCSDMFYGIGGLISGLLVAGIFSKLNPESMIIVLLSVGTVNLFTLTQNESVLTLYVCSFVLGLTNSAIRILMNSLLMKLVDHRYMGRAMSVWLAISLICQCGLSLTLGTYIDRYGSAIGIVSMGAIMSLGLLIYVMQYTYLKLENEKKAGSNI